jgi:hypothetical protein
MCGGVHLKFNSNHNCDETKDAQPAHAWAQGVGAV